MYLELMLRNKWAIIYIMIVFIFWGYIQYELINAKFSYDNKVSTNKMVELLSDDLQDDYNISKLHNVLPNKWINGPFDNSIGYVLIMHDKKTDTLISNMPIYDSKMRDIINRYNIFHDNDKSFNQSIFFNEGIIANIGRSLKNQDLLINSFKVEVNKDADIYIQHIEPTNDHIYNLQVNKWALLLLFGSIAAFIFTISIYEYEESIFNLNKAINSKVEHNTNLSDIIKDSENNSDKNDYKELILNILNMEKEIKIITNNKINELKEIISKNEQI